MSSKIEQELEEANKAAENLTKNMTLIDKNDKPYAIICRESDGYIDVTNLCKAGGRLYKNWYRLEKTKEFLRILEEDIKNEYQQNNAAHFCTALLIKYETGYGSNQGTWVHPKVAINIAQWISPKFDVQVTKWVHQLLVVGSVRLTDEHKDEEIMDIQKSKIKYNILKTEGKEEEAYLVKEEIDDRLLELETKNKELENKWKASLEENNRLSKYLERKKRIQYDKGKCVYILRHKEFRDCYKIGIANDLTSRKSTYDTAAPIDFDMLFHVHTMYNSIVETMVKRKLVDYLYTLNKEWYYVESGPDILVENVKRAVEYFESD